MPLLPVSPPLFMPAAVPEGELRAYASNRLYFYTGAPPLEYLMPRCVAAVTHGDVSTISAAMRHAVPIVATPVFREHTLWAQCVERLNVGVALRTHLVGVGAEELSEAIINVVYSTSLATSIRRSCFLHRRKLRAENGLAYATAVVHAVATEKMAGLVAKGHPSATFSGYEPPAAPKALAMSGLPFVFGEEALGGFGGGAA